MADDRLRAGESPRDPALEAQISAAIIRCGGGDRQALRLIYDLEAARRVWRGARGFDPARGAALTWLYAIVRNQALTILRAERRYEASELTETDLEEPDAALSRLPEISAMRLCLQQLDDRRRTAIVLAYVHGFSHGELAGRLGVPLGTVKSWIRRGLIALQECMG